MGLSEREDSRPVNYGDLVAARWYDDPEYRIGKIDDYAPNGISMSEIQNAHHVVILKNADQYNRMMEEASQRLFDPVVQGFPEVRTGDFDPMATLALDTALESAVILWLNWNYPK